MLVEKSNQQSSPEEIDYALTPRIETWQDGRWYTNLYDLKADVSVDEMDSAIQFDAHVHLVDRDRTDPPNGRLTYKLGYRFDSDHVVLTAKCNTRQQSCQKTNLALPLISRVNEPVRQISGTCIEIEKEKGTVCVNANVPLRIKKTERGRVFNLVPGFEAVPIVAELPNDPAGENLCEIVISISTAARPC